jgi:hypothetical protein
MSNRYKGGIISATPPTLVAGAGASGTWTLEQQMQATAAGLWPVNGPFYIEDVFSTYLYTGNGGTQTITNGINLSTNGGLVWIKWRNTTYGSVDHNLYDTSRGVLNRILSNTTDAQVTQANSLTAFNSTGFSLGGTSGTNGNNANYASWTFRKQPKFFDVVTYTGTGSVRTIAHNLGSVPGCIIVKTLSTPGNDWGVYHRSLGATYKLNLNNDTAAALSTGFWNNTTPTSTEFTVATSGITNQSGETYVAYLFAHDAGGFGLTGTDNVISCGSFSGNTTVNLGFEPQWILLKRSSGVERWYIIDNMRGWPVSGDANYLAPNTSDAESQTNQIYPNATGFSTLTGGGDFIYIAIRRGPMKVPTSGTSVFAPVAYTGDSTNNRILTTGFASDAVIITKKSQSSYGREFTSTLTAYREIFANLTDAETADTAMKTANTGLSVSNTGHFQMSVNSTGETYIAEIFGRAPGFFDEVCYTGNSTARTVNHNLGVAPELIIVKARSGTFAGNIDWFVYASPLGNSSRLLLNTTGALADGQTTWNSTTPTSSVFSLGTSDNINGTGYTYVAYLFATCAGVSKVGSYTGTATTLQIDCGFTAGSRFVLIKRTDSTGDWYVWDSARGIVAGNDPYLLLNSTAAEVTNTDYVDTYNAGFEISSTAPAAINANGGTYIFLAIA